MDYLNKDLGMNRETAPTVPNQMMPDQYTSLNPLNSPQETIQNQMRTQASRSAVVTSDSQKKADAMRTVDGEVTESAQRNYENQRFLNNYLVNNLLAAGEGLDLMELGQGDPEHTLRVIQASKQMANGMQVNPFYG